MEHSASPRPSQSVVPYLSSLVSRYGYQILTLVPFAYLLYVVIKYGVAVPCLDQWDLVPVLDKMYRGELTGGDLWAQHNEHRNWETLLASASDSHELA
jgi:hypothetical protein